MFGLKSPLYSAYVRRKKYDFYGSSLTAESEPTASRG